MNMIRKGQLVDNNDRTSSAASQFYSTAFDRSGRPTFVGPITLSRKNRK
jgi:hypothetical protein